MMVIWPLVVECERYRNTLNVTLHQMSRLRATVEILALNVELEAAGMPEDKVRDSGERQVAVPC